MSVTAIAAMCLLSLFWGAAFTVSLVLAHRERKDLYDRLTGADAEAYLRLRERQTAPKAPEKSAHRRAVDAFHRAGTGMNAEG